MFAIKSEPKSVSLPILSPDGVNKNDFYCADVIGNKRFAQNYGGYPRNDISVINEQTNLTVAKSLLNDLAQVPTLSDTSGKSEQELLMSVRSKYLQTPSEVIPVIESEIGRRVDARLSALAAKSGPDKSEPDTQAAVDVEPE